MLNRIISALTSAGVVAAIVWSLNLTEKNSLLLVGAATAITYVCWGMGALHRRRLGVDAALSADDTPLSATLWGARRAAVLGLVIAAALGLGWVGGIWSPTWRKGELLPIENQADGATKHLDAEINVVDTFVRPPTIQIDAEVRSPNGEPLSLLADDAFELRIDEKPISIEHVEPITYELDLAAIFLRDISNSTSAAPFPEFIETATLKLVQGLRTSKRHSKVRIVDFAGNAVEVIPWTAPPTTPISLRPAASQQADKSALLTLASKAIDDLARQDKSTRLLILIADGGNNVVSSYSAKGLAAYARSKSVVIHVVALPTEQHNETFLRSLASETGGRYLDASRDMNHVAELVSVRDIRKAYRLVASFSDSLNPAKIDVRIRTNRLSTTDNATRALAAIADH